MKVVINKKMSNGKIKRIVSRPEDIVIIVLEPLDMENIRNMKEGENIYAYVGIPAVHGPQVRVRKILKEMIEHEKHLDVVKNSDSRQRWKGTEEEYDELLVLEYELVQGYYKNKKDYDRKTERYNELVERGKGKKRKRREEEGC